MTYLPYQAVQISDHVHWVGAIDWELRDFHGYATPRGSTYNAFLILADKITLIDTVKAPFKDELLGRISSLIDPTTIDYIISNHSETDHTGSLPEVIKQVEPSQVFASVKGVEALQAHYGIGNKITPVEKGGTLSLGNMTLTFQETRMVHWPDSMFTYLDADKILFSNDGFGMHLASSQRFADELDLGIIKEETATYYANILMPMSPAVAKAMNGLEKLGKIDIIAPDHGPVWRKDLESVIAWYHDWSSRVFTDKAVVIYDTMWQSTAKMAKAISEGIMSGGVKVKLMPLKVTERSQVALETLDAAALVVGSPNLNSGILPTVADILTYLEGLAPKTPIGAVFASYGWSDKVIRLLEEWMTRMKIELVGEGVKSNYVPHEDVIKDCFSLGTRVAEQIKEFLKM